MINITLPDGSSREYPPQTTVGDVAASIGPGLAKQAVGGMIDDQLVDLRSEITDDCRLRILTKRDPESLHVLRHSTAHVLAQAVQELFPQVKLGIGPATEDGFYYDFEYDGTFGPEDLQAIEQRMGEIVKRDLEIDRVYFDKDEALRKFDEMGERLKTELIEAKAEPPVSCYRQGDFIDFCRGPHLRSTGQIPKFKLLTSSGAYWLGDEHNQMLQRINGTAFWKNKDLEEHLQRLEEIKKRDHRRLGKDLELFSIQEDAGAGLIFWHPRGAVVRELIETYWKEKHREWNYEPVVSPHIAHHELWKTSGHYDYYRENMFTLDIDEHEYVLKPMNCPGHILIYNSKRRSYRDLPVRYSEMGTVYRYEKSGVLHGTLRVRGFTQDDAHIFCTPDQLEAEVISVFDQAEDILRTFGFDEYRVELSLSDPEDMGKYAGTPEQWAHAEGLLERVLKERNVEYHAEQGEAAFYGPKIDLKLLDALRREWQLTTIQFDFGHLPKQFGINYVGADSKEHQCVIIHRALLGSIERFFGTLIEHYAGAFPFWLAPVQAVVLPLSDKFNDYAEKRYKQLKEKGYRVEIDTRKEKLNYRIRDAQLMKTPFMLIAGGREEEAGTLSVRNRFEGDQGSSGFDELCARFDELQRTRAVKP